MTLYYVNTGSGPNSQDGDSLRTAFNKINSNFSQINSGSLGAVLIQSPSVPQGYGPGTLWYDTESGRTYIYYNGSWVDANPSTNQRQNTVAVGLYDPETDVYSSTVTNVSKINFDVLADFSLTNQGGGSVLVGMNSTFKYIQIAGQETLTAQGVDTLTLVAGTGTQLITSNAGLKNQQTITFISTGSGSGNATFPPSSVPGFLYTDGEDVIEWRQPELNSLINGSYSVRVTEDGNFELPDGTPQRTAYVPPVPDGAASAHYVLIKGVTNNALQFNSGFSYNPSSGQIAKPRSILFNDNTVQTTAWLGSTATLFSSVSGAGRSSLTLTTATLRLSTGTITFPDLSVQRTAFLGYIDYGDIRNIPIVTTSSLNNNGFTAQLSTSGEFTIPNKLTTKYLTTDVFSIVSTQTGGVLSSVGTTTNVSIQTLSTQTSYKWTFNNDGTITFPDNSIQQSAGRNIYDAILSGTKYLSVLSSGIVKFPDGTDQSTAFTGKATSLQNGAYTLRPVSVPADIDYGSPNDLVGDIAFDQTYLYYCLSPYGFKTYSTGTVNSRVDVNYITISQSSTKFNRPQPGWRFQQADSSTIYVLTSEATAAVIRSTPVWVLTSSTASLSYTTGTIFTVTNTTIQQSNWIKTAVTDRGLMTKVSKFVDQDEPFTNDVIRVQWTLVELEISPGVIQRNNQLAFSAVSGIISNVTYNIVSSYADGGIISASGTFTELTATLEPVGPYSKQVGDMSTLIINSFDGNFCYRVTAMTGENFSNNFISIEQLL